MFDIGWSELVLIGVAALIVVGPRDLPQMFRTLGRFTAKARGMAREFSKAMEDAARDTGIDEATRDLRAMTSKKALGLDALENAATKFEQWKPGLTKPTTPRGPATQALADRKAAEAAAREAAPALVPDPDAPAVPAEAAARPAGADSTGKTPQPAKRRTARAKPAAVAAADPAPVSAAEEPAATAAAPARAAPGRRRKPAEK